MNLGNLGRQTFAAPLAALTLVAGGGIALAASGGDPAPQAVEHRTVASPSPRVEPKPTDEPGDQPEDEPTSDASPSPSLTGLCKAYRAGGYASSTKNGHVNPAWSALEAAAGGSDGVDSYCGDRLAADAAAKAARRGTPESDDVDEPKSGKPAKGPKPDKAHDDDAIDNDDGADAIDNDDAGDVDSSDEGEGGSRGSEHGRH